MPGTWVSGGTVCSRWGRTQHDVAEDLVLGHLDVADGDTQAENLLELELDGRADLSDLVAQVLSVRDGGGELAGWVGIWTIGRCCGLDEQWTYLWRDRGRANGESA